MGKSKNSTPEVIKTTPVKIERLTSFLSLEKEEHFRNLRNSYEEKKNFDWDRTTYWKVTAETQKKFTILRYVRFSDDSVDTRERYPRHLYSSFDEDKKKCEELCRVLNYRYKAKRDSKQYWKLKTDFLKISSSELSKNFEDYMFARSLNKSHAYKCRKMVEKHFLQYFHHERKEPLYDYLEWHSLDVQAELIEHLLTKENSSLRMGANHLLSVKTIKAIIQNINHLFKFLHLHSKGQIPQLKFTFPTLTNARLNAHEVKRKKKLSAKKKVIPSKEYIDEETFQKILDKAPDNLKAAIWLSYHYGLRRSEVMGLELTDIRKGHITITQQLKRITILRRPDKSRAQILEKHKDLLKNRKTEGRKVPHWYSSPAKTYNWIDKLYVTHPSVVSKMWISLMKEMKLNYTFHNLRNAFASNALRDMNDLKISATDIQLALGHSDIRTVMIYLRDYRKLDDDEIWKPKAG